MRNYLILIENRKQMEFIVDKFDTIHYNVKKDFCCDDYVICKRDETVRYYVKTQNEIFRGYRYNGYINYRVGWSKELNEKIYYCLIERYFDKYKVGHNMPILELHCWDEEEFDNAIKLVENYDKE